MNNRYDKLIFPIAISSNIYSLTVLFIIAGFSGKAQLAADIAIIQGGLMAVFFSLSGNARSLILSCHVGTSKSEILNFRLLMILPSSVIVYALISYSINISMLLIIGIILRRCFEWIAEIELAEHEKLQDTKFAYKYVFVNSIGLFLLIICMLFFSDIFFFALFIWAILPLIFCLTPVFDMFVSRNYSLNISRNYPHIGSSSIIGVSVYFFRILIVIIAGKILAGQLFAAYAMGGLINSIYTQALGPTLIYNYKSINKICITAFFIMCTAVGSGVVLSNTYFDTVTYPNIFMITVGYSLIGGGVMVVSQWYRLSILQEKKMSVFVPDALANILLLISIPIIYFVFGKIALSCMFLWSANLSFMIYAPLYVKLKMK